MATRVTVHLQSRIQREAVKVGDYFVGTVGHGGYGLYARTYGGYVSVRNPGDTWVDYSTLVITVDRVLTSITVVEDALPAESGFWSKGLPHGL